MEEDKLHNEYPTIHAKITTVGVQYIFVNQGECNLSLDHEFFASCNTLRVEINNGYARNSGVRFLVEVLNDFLVSRNCDHAEFVDLVE